MVVVASAPPVQLNEYEQQREARIAENMRKIKDLGLTEAVQELAAFTQPKEKKERKARTNSGTRALDETSEVRRSSRDVKRVASYKEEDFLKELNHLGGMRGSRGPRCAREVDDAEVQALRERNGVCDEQGCSQEGSAGKRRGPVDSGKGVRIQGGKIYDSKFGVTCHWCRQKTLTENVTCSNPGCGKGKRLAYTFCKSCLLNRHGEDSTAAAASGLWVCPCCRGSCGTGCIGCCNCGPCRKKAGLEPTGQVKGSALAAGFNNVHDYLVYLVTGESSEEIAARKPRHAWAAWLTADAAAAPELAAEADAAAPQQEHEEPNASGMGSCNNCPGKKLQRKRQKLQAAGSGVLDETVSQLRPAADAAAPVVAGAGVGGSADEGCAARATAAAGKRGRGRPPLPKKLQGSCPPAGPDPGLDEEAGDKHKEADEQAGQGCGEQVQAPPVLEQQQPQQQEDDESEEEDDSKLTRKQRALKKLGLRARS